MRRFLATAVTLGLLSTTLPLQAASLAERFRDGAVHAGVHGSTLGLGLNAGYDFSKDLGVRGLANYFNLDFDEKEAGNEYEGKLKLRSTGALFDWHPFWGAFRLTGGALLNNNALSASTKGTSLGIGGHRYDAELDLRVKFERIAPYLGIGWTTGRGRSGLSFSADLGALFRSSPRISATGRAGACDFAVSNSGAAEVACPDGSSVIVDELRRDLEEEHDQLMDDLDKFELYPVLSLGISYRF